MVTFHERFARYLSGVLFVSLVSLVACSGGGAGSPSNPPSNSGPVQGTQGQSITIPLSETSAATLPSTAGITSTIALPSNTAPAGAMLTISVSNQAPSSLPKIPANQPQAFAFFTLTASADATFKTVPKMSLTFTSAPRTEGQFYAWMYDTSGKAWTDLGTVDLSGSTLSFGANTIKLTLKRNATYIIAAFTAAPGATCIVCPPPTPTPGPTPAAGKLYVGSSCNGMWFINAYDEEGIEFQTPGGFPNIFLTTGITYDSVLNRLYVVNGVPPAPAPVTAYDLAGNRIATSGTFPGIPDSSQRGITFDAATTHLYVTSGGVTIFDEEGHNVTPAGAFPNLVGALGIAYDSGNQNLYVSFATFSGGGIKVFDGSGNPVTTTNTFPGLSTPADVAIDSADHELFVADEAQVLVYDEQGNPIPSHFPFDPTNPPLSVAFDPNNKRVYVGRVSGMFAFDRSGNPVNTTGTFPNINEGATVTFVP